MKRMGEARPSRRWEVLADTDLEDLCEMDELWGKDSTLIEDWFAAGDELDGVDDWSPWLADAWEEGVVLRQPRLSGAQRASVRVK